MLLRAEENIDEHAVLRCHLIGRQVCRYFETPGKASKFPGIGAGKTHDPL